MQLGIFAKTFAGTEPGAVLSAVKAAGYGCAQFNLACAGLPSLPDEVPETVTEAIRAAAAGTGVRLVALSGTTNMIHPDPALRRAGLRRLGTVIDTARALDIPLVTLCTGTRDPEDMWRGHPDNAAPAAWTDLCRALEPVITQAEAAGIDLGIEPEQANVVRDAAGARRLLDTMGTPRLRIVLDPANLFEAATPAEAGRIVAEAIDRLAGRIAMAHAKDRAADGRFVAAGRGVVDFPAMLARLASAGFDGPVVTHGLEPADAPDVARFLRGLGLS